MKLIKPNVILLPFLSFLICNTSIAETFESKAYKMAYEQTNSFKSDNLKTYRFTRKINDMPDFVLTCSYTKYTPGGKDKWIANCGVYIGWRQDIYDEPYRIMIFCIDCYEYFYPQIAYVDIKLTSGGTLWISPFIEVPEKIFKTLFRNKDITFTGGREGNKITINKFFVRGFLDRIQDLDIKK